MRRESPELVILTGGGARAARRCSCAALARDAEISTLALLEPTDSERAERVGRLGVTETIMKPVAPDDAVATARRLIERRRLQERTGIIGESAAIQEVLVKIEQMAPVSSTVLIQGESGHRQGAGGQGASTTSRPGAASRSSRSTARRCPRRCSSRSCSATRRAPSPARRSGGWAGSSWPTPGPSSSTRSARSRPATQVKLLRVLESRTFFRVGGTQPIKVDVRVMAATNRSLRDAVALGEFRDDLYYRLNVLNIYLAAAARAAGGHPAPGPPVHPRAGPGSTTAPSAASRRRRCSGW